VSTQTWLRTENSLQPKIFSAAVIYWLVIILLAHFFAPPGYAWMHNTISDLASQGHTYKWIMQAGMIGFGALVISAVGLACLRARKVIWSLLPVALYGICILLSGIFCTAPIDPKIPYSLPEAQIHSGLATFGGLIMCLGVFWQVFASHRRQERVVHLIFFIGLVGVSSLFMLVDNGAFDLGIGIIQRILYLVGFAWLIYLERCSNLLTR
jgi:hypothetical protein